MKRSLLFFSFIAVVSFANAQLSGYYKQDFEGNKFPPGGWLRVSQKGNNQWVSSTLLPHGGKSSAFNSYNVPKGSNYLITPQFTVASGDSLSFWFAPEFVGFTDSFSIKVSTTNTDLLSFNKTIAKFADGENYPPQQTYQRVSLSLADFAGQNIYIAFKHVDDDGDGIFLDDVAMGTAPPDVAAVSIDLPKKVSSGVAISPKATFQNLGSQSATFDVTFTVGSYTSTKTITDLPSQASQQVTFDSWAVPPGSGTYTAVTYTSFEPDVDHSNDTLSETVKSAPGFNNAGWISKRNIPAGKFGTAVTSYSTGTGPTDTSYLFSIGGIDETFRQSHNVFRFNAKTAQWTKMAPVPDSRFTASAFTYKGKIFYIAGYHPGFFSAFKPVHTVSIYDIATDTWSQGTDIPYKVGDYAACQYQDSLIYVIGGYNGTDAFRKVQIYNASTDTWTMGTDILGNGRYGAAAGVASNKIVLFGGSNIVNGIILKSAMEGTIDLANPSNISWTSIADYPAGPEFRPGGVGVKNGSQNLVYFTGGDADGSGTSTTAATWAYDVDANQWLLGPNKITAVNNLTSLTTIIVKDTVYIASVGGYDGSNVQRVNEWLKLGPTSTVLPIHLLDFTATLQNNKTLLNWKVAEDGTGGYYIIQRSSDAVHFTDISDKLSAGRIAVTKTYTSYDVLPVRGYNYYRIKIVNADGSITYSAIKAVNNTSVSAAVYASNIYPNPSHGPLNVILQNNSGKETSIGITVSDVAGKKIISENKTVDVSLSFTYNLQPGTYIVNMFSQDGAWKQSVKVVVE